MNEYDDVLGQVRETFAGLQLDMPVEEVFSRDRARRRRRASGFTAAAVATAGAATAVTLGLGGPAPAHIGGPSPVNPRPVGPSPVGPSPVRLTAFSVRSGPGHSTVLVVRKGPGYQRLDPDALRAALARHGIPALVTVGTFCKNAPGVAGSIGKVIHPSGQSNGMVIDGRSIPPGNRLSIGLFPSFTRLMLIKDGAHLICGRFAHQAAVHILPPGNTIREPRSER